MTDSEFQIIDEHFQAHRGIGRAFSLRDDIRPHFDVGKFIADAFALSEREIVFRDQGNDPDTGMDCVNIPVYLFKSQGLSLPPEIVEAMRAYDPNTDGKRMFALMRKWLVEIPINEARAGDLYLFRGKTETRHLAIRLTDDNPPIVYEAYRSDVTKRAKKGPLDPVRARLIVAAFRIPQTMA